MRLRSARVRPEPDSGKFISTLYMSSDISDITPISHMLLHYVTEWWPSVPSHPTDYRAEHRASTLPRTQVPRPRRAPRPGSASPCCGRWARLRQSGDGGREPLPAGAMPNSSGCSPSRLPVESGGLDLEQRGHGTAYGYAPDRIPRPNPATT